MNIEEINKKEYVHYVYKITNKLSNKYYIGVHSVRIQRVFSNENEFIDFLRSDGYWGSGSDIVKAIKIDGLKNFVKDIIKYFETREDAFKEEARLVTLDTIKDPLCYNLSIGGLGKIDIGSKIRVLDLVTNKKLYLDKSIYELSKDQYTIISSTSGKKWINNGMKNKLIERGEVLPEGWVFGKLQKKISTNKIERPKQYKNIKTGKISYLTNYDWFNNSDKDVYPITFFNRDGLLLTYELLNNEFSNLPSWSRLSEKLNISRSSLILVRDFYQSIGKKFISSAKLHRSTRKPTKGFSEKTYITNKITGKHLVVDKNLIDNYDNNEWYLGKIVRIDLINKKDQIFNDYIFNKYTVREISKKYKTSNDIIKLILNLSDENSKKYYLYKDEDKRVGLFNKDMLNILFNNGWKI